LELLELQSHWQVKDKYQELELELELELEADAEAEDDVKVKHATTLPLLRDGVLLRSGIKERYSNVNNSLFATTDQWTVLYSIGKASLCNRLC